MAKENNLTVLASGEWMPYFHLGLK
jgi:hypothetical protein